MADDFHVDVDGVQLKRLFDKFDALRGRKIAERSMDQSGKYLIGWIKRFRLTGPRPKYLGVVTGRLRSSISSSKTQKVNDGYKTQIGTNVDYAEAHEFGFRGRVNVAAHFRRRKRSTHFVRAHSRMMNVPSRPFFRPAIESSLNQQKIINIFTMNINKELEKKT